MQSQVDAVGLADTVANNAEKIQYSASGVAVICGLTLNEWGVVVGILVAVAGFLLTWYYKHKAFALREKQHEAEMKALSERRDRRASDKIVYFKPPSADDEVLDE